MSTNRTKPAPDINTQLLLDIQEQMIRMNRMMSEMRMELKSDIRQTQRQMSQCKLAFDECAKGYNDIKKSYIECAKGYKSIQDKCEDMEDTIMSCSGSSDSVLRV